VLPEPGRPLAKVGEEVVTYHDVMGVVLQHRAYEQLRNAHQTGGPAEKREAEKQITMMKIAVLEDLINRSLLAQEAKRHITKRKEGATMLNSIYDEADQRFRESEVLPLQRKFNLDNEAQVREKLAEQGWSLSEMQQSFRQRYIGEMYLYSILRDKVKVELPDMRKYYSEHAKKHEFDRPALITWREIVVEPVKSAPATGAKDDTKIPFEGDSINLAAARGEAIAILERLRKGEDFATLAKKESDGPAASRSHGGLMETSPGGYGIPAVNKALETLRLGQVSDLIEGPDGYHIVKVEKRRAAGPSTFEELQSKIKPLIENEKSNAERLALITKLRKNNFIKIYNAKSKKVDEPKPAKT
jgi:peptidyl-prolyl cis-trans isomerase SurA